MPAALLENRYGKSRVRLVKIVRHAERHDLHELTVAIALEGDFESAHTTGDNSLVLPTDTMKNTVYALAAQHRLDSIESFALHLGRHFTATVPQVTVATIDIAAARWERATVGGRPHAHTFIRSEPETATCSATVRAGDDASLAGGIQDLIILKTSGSGFAGFYRDRYTTLAETGDRLLGTALTARWNYARPEADFLECRCTIRSALVETFARHESRSVQHTLYAMGERALDACAAIDRIALSMPNRHCLPVDLAPFGLSNENAIFVPVDEPFGLIEATLERR